MINSSPAYDLVNAGLRTGIEDSTGNDGLQVLDTFPAPGSAVKFFYPGHFSTNDLENSSISLGQNFPNPADGQTTVQFRAKKTGEAKVSITNMIGSHIESLSLGKLPVGNHSFRINTLTYPPGIYFYSLSIGGSATTKKMIVSK